jgi:SAM-dependent methyltransferase
MVRDVRFGSSGILACPYSNLRASTAIVRLADYEGTRRAIARRLDHGRTWDGGLVTELLRDQNGHADVSPEIRRFWDTQAPAYDDSPAHYPSRAQERAAWAAALRRMLPDPPARILDVGAGTGFLSVLLAEHGYRVTALDFSPGMLQELRARATDLGLEVETVEADAMHPPAGAFDAVVERHLLWTLPDPAAALAAWHAAAPEGRLVLFEGSWGTADAVTRLRTTARAIAERIRGAAPRHQHYSERVARELPHARGFEPGELAELVQASPWGRTRLERLRDVEWAAVEGTGFLDELLGTHPRWAVIAGT